MARVLHDGAWVHLDAQNLQRHHVVEAARLVEAAALRLDKLLVGKVWAVLATALPAQDVHVKGLWDGRDNVNTTAVQAVLQLDEHVLLLGQLVHHLVSQWVSADHQVLHVLRNALLAGDGFLQGGNSQVVFVQLDGEVLGASGWADGDLKARCALHF
eukprot:CAMPEP_0182454402 /NCGR_PEP_ID=MMETSP1319-20130603/1058_1 /TAXON_ID=172717 /ORGANISM="Bolidomonas pacifica, Strain RCC208" /LENGTH=156 /DNA_ID=CAMNT_0024652415 /DNA_START=21 /DNA_END=491 /DNA_ORIENTATION=-